MELYYITVFGSFAIAGIWTIMGLFLINRINEVAQQISDKGVDITEMVRHVSTRVENVRNAIDRNTEAMAEPDVKYAEDPVAEKRKFHDDMVAEAREHLDKAIEAIRAIDD